MRSLPWGERDMPNAETFSPPVIMVVMMVTLFMRTEGRVDVGNDHNNGGYDGDCNDAVGKTLKRATPMATMVRVPKSVPR